MTGVPRIQAARCPLSDIQCFRSESMSRYSFAGRLAFALALCLPAMAGLSTARAQGSPHDFTGTGSQANCLYCHARPSLPGSVMPAEAAWSPARPAPAYRTYSSPTLDADVGRPGTLSLLCLSCHDGTIATDDGWFGPRPLGTDLADDHPVSFRYDAALALRDGRLRLPDEAPGSHGGTIATDNLFNGRFECTSCHNVHDNRHGNYLIEPNDRSQLCYRCHVK